MEVEASNTIGPLPQCDIPAESCCQGRERQPIWFLVNLQQLNWVACVNFIHYLLLFTLKHQRNFVFSGKYLSKKRSQKWRWSATVFTQILVHCFRMIDIKFYDCHAPWWLKIISKHIVSRVIWIMQLFYSLRLSPFSLMVWKGKGLLRKRARNKSSR